MRRRRALPGRLAADTGPPRTGVRRGGSNRLASWQDLLTDIGRPPCRWTRPGPSRYGGCPGSGRCRRACRTRSYPSGPRRGHHRCAGRCRRARDVAGGGRSAGRPVGGQLREGGGDVSVGAFVAFGKRASSAEEVDDGAPPGRPDSGVYQKGEAVPRGPGEGGLDGPRATSPPRPAERGESGEALRGRELWRAIHPQAATQLPIRCRRPSRSEGRRLAKAKSE
jgi:hypothetical protein